MNVRVFFLCGAALWAAAAVAQEAGATRARHFSAGDDGGGTPVNEIRPLDPDGRLSVKTVAGTLAVTGWERNQVQITGTLGAGTERLEISGGPSELTVAVKLPHPTRTGGESDLRLMVPATARLELETVSANIAVRGARGPLKVNTISGDMLLTVDTPRLAVQTVSGDLTVRGAAAEAQIDSVSGDLHLSGLKGRVAAQTVSGNLELAGGPFSDLRLKTISGDMRLQPTFQHPAVLDGESLSGDIFLRLPADVVGTALLKSFSGVAQCDHTLPVRELPGKKREYVWGDGQGVTVQLFSFSGDIRIERK